MSKRIILLKLSAAAFMFLALCLSGLSGLSNGSARTSLQEYDKDETTDKL